MTFRTALLGGLAALTLAHAPQAAAQTPIAPGMWGSTQADYAAAIGKLARRLPEVGYDSDAHTQIQAFPEVKEAAVEFLQIVALAEHDGMDVESLLRSDGAEDILSALTVFIQPDGAANTINHPFMAVLVFEIVERRLALPGITQQQRDDDLAMATFAMDALGRSDEIAGFVESHGYDPEAAASRSGGGMKGVVRNVALALMRNGETERALELARAMAAAAASEEDTVRRELAMFEAFMLADAGRHSGSAGKWRALAAEEGVSASRQAQFEYQEIQQLLAGEHWSRAERAAQWVLEDHPDDAPTSEQLARALVGSGRIDDAMRMVVSAGSDPSRARRVGAVVAEHLFEQEDWARLEQLVEAFEAATGEEARRMGANGWLAIGKAIMDAPGGSFDAPVILDVVMTARERGDEEAFRRYLALYRALPDRIGESELTALLADNPLAPSGGRMGDDPAFAAGATREMLKVMLPASQQGLPLPIRMETLERRMDVAWQDILAEPATTDQSAFILAQIAAENRGDWAEVRRRQDRIRQFTASSMTFDTEQERAEFLACPPVIADYRRLVPGGDLFRQSEGCATDKTASGSIGQMRIALSLLLDSDPAIPLADARLKLEEALVEQTPSDDPRTGAEYGIENARIERRDIARSMADLMWRDRGASADEATRERAFELLQWAMLGQKGEAVIRGAAERLAASIDPELVDLTREYRVLASGLSQMPQITTTNANETAEEAAERRAIERARQLDTEQKEQRAREIRTIIERDFPDYFDFIQPRPLTLADVQAGLAPDEALLVLLPSDNLVHAFAVDADRSMWVASDMTLFETDRRVTRLLWDLGTPMDIPDPVHMRWVRQGGEGYPFARGLAYELFDRIVKPVDSILKGKKRVFTSNGSVLSGLPLGVLVTRPPAGSDGDPDALRNTAWLAERHALINLPSVASLRLLEGQQDQRSEQVTLAAFGDPVLEGEARDRGTVRKRNASMVRSGGVNATDQAFVDRLRQMERLPRTGPELRAIQHLLNAPESSVRLQEKASEPEVRQADLANVSILAFATHGVMPREILGLEEPGLVMTPPQQATPENDGLLSASEIASLKLDADWVLLSACNTAVGAPGEAGNLTDAFFFAGARSVLASHWPVGDQAAEALTTKTLAAQLADPDLTRAESLQQAMREVRLDASHDRVDEDGRVTTWAHPSVWAPFSIYGDIDR